MYWSLGSRALGITSKLQNPFVMCHTDQWGSFDQSEGSISPQSNFILGFWGFLGFWGLQRSRSSKCLFFRIEILTVSLFFLLGAIGFEHSLFDFLLQTNKQRDIPTYRETWLTENSILSKIWKHHKKQNTLMSWMVLLFFGHLKISSDI